MEVEFGDPDLERMDREKDFSPRGLPSEAARGFRKAMRAIRAALDERDLYRGGLRMEKLDGKRKGQHSVRLNDQWRLVMTLEEANAGGRKAVLIEIVDYH